MSLRIKGLEIAASDWDRPDALRDVVARYLGLPPIDICQVAVVRKSLDARRKGRPIYCLTVDATVNDEQVVIGRLKSKVEKSPESIEVDPLAGGRLASSPRHRPVVIGSGPAGVFAALVLARAGWRPIVVERGEDVDGRSRTVGALLANGTFAAESNFCFGEGGAGTFSDGKLVTGRRHPWISWLFRRWVEFGAPPEILYEAHPHVGTDNLVTMARRMRQDIVASGGEFLFGCRVDDVRSGTAGSRFDIVLHDGRVVPADHVVLAIGHSARDTYAMLQNRGVAMRQKPFAVGTRVEHPRDLIDRIQYGKVTGLPAAEYKLTAHVGDRGIWSFCMCPGGTLLPTGAQPEHLAVNGMSAFNRASRFSNSALVVNIRCEDYDRGDVLDGMRFQADLERLAFRAGGANGRAPAQRWLDFAASRASSALPETSYRPGITPARLDQLFSPWLRDSIKGAMPEFDRRMRGFAGADALFVGVETKTSSPLSLDRNEQLQSVSHPGLFPAGEGAGHAGGIVSAALDGVRVACSMLGVAEPQGDERVES